MFAASALAVAALAFASTAAAEQHQVTFTNNCGYGTPLFLYQGNMSPQGATTVQGQLNGGIAWLDNGASCATNGVGCGAVEFTFQNTGYSQADITLEPEGSHNYLYPIGFNFINGCSNGLFCDNPNCIDQASFSPTQVPLADCQANDSGINVIFC
ncbi:hypothetical protein CONPUDRAFT_160881 [Coniophora puteana RWD-64-598 SS2]|uniref:Glycopeptide n=1 Tax=Coniophora puteana (strain RWD-64-598) TaxID=741705 RepID=A0A5M3N3J3_CONPW|nr:uncharacterized protein CONPUDRAFT_160881 [Coniophora puteana RWD-64-598 SS2]EIW85972.1 hypothetical protein CONPUDRAFT_160881 [Coniophora puteana RWD-64-598 SS2]